MVTDSSLSLAGHIWSNGSHLMMCEFLCTWKAALTSLALDSSRNHRSAGLTTLSKCRVHPIYVRCPAPAWTKSKSMHAWTLSPYIHITCYIHREPVVTPCGSQGALNLHYIPEPPAHATRYSSEGQSWTLQAVHVRAGLRLTVENAISASSFKSFLKLQLCTVRNHFNVWVAKKR